MERYFPAKRSIIYISFCTTLFPPQVTKFTDCKSAHIASILQLFLAKNEFKFPIYISLFTTCIYLYPLLSNNAETAVNVLQRSSNPPIKPLNTTSKVPIAMDHWSERRRLVKLKI